MTRKKESKRRERGESETQLGSWMRGREGSRRLPMFDMLFKRATMGSDRPTLSVDEDERR